MGINLALKTLHIKRAGKQKFKKQHVISSMSHTEKRVDCTCIYVLNASNKGSGETAQCAETSELSLFVLAIKTTADCVSISSKYTCTPASNLGYLAPPPPRTIFHGCQIVHWDPLDGKRRCPQKNFGLGYVKLHGFYANP